MKTVRTFFQGVVIILCIAAITVFRGEMKEVFFALRDVIRNVAGSTTDVRAYKDLESENISLRKQVEFLELKTGTKKNPDGFVDANVYSTYPFNNKTRMLVDKGSENGIDVGMPVFSRPGILIGRVHAVQKTQSEVITVFDPEWKTSVTIGTSSVKAVVQGGNVPTLEFIPKNAQIQNGDEVKNISPEFPFGVVLGSVKELTTDEKNLWKVASLETPFIFDELSTVKVLTTFP